MRQRATAQTSIANRGRRFVDLTPQIAALFAAGEVGGELAPYDFSTMWQDVARTTPVTAPGQAVASALLKYSGGIYLQQATMTARWVLQIDVSGRYYLALDGVDDRVMFSSAINLNSGLIGLAMESVSVSGRAVLSANSAGYIRRGDGGVAYWLRNNGAPNPNSPLLAKARQSLTIGTNGTTSTEFIDSTDPGGVSVGTATGLSGILILGSYDNSGTLPLQANIYSAIFRAGPYTATQADLVRQYGVQRMGIVSP